MILNEKAATELPFDVEVECVIVPTSNHWRTRCWLSPENRIAYCQSLTKDQKEWWKKIINLDDCHSLTTSFKVGLIDIGNPSSSIENFPIYKDLNKKSSMIYSCDSDHGLSTSTLLSNGLSHGNHSLFYCDATHYLDPEKFNIQKVVYAISDLVNIHKVDFISISAGLYLDPCDEEDQSDLETLENVLAVAESFGCIVVAAVGNHPNHAPPTIPAALPNVIGVGSVGKVGLAPAGTISNEKEQKAAQFNHTSNDENNLYLDPDSCSGRGLNCLAPGISIFVDQNDGKLLELTGTSFAAPIAVIAMCQTLGANQDYLRVPFHHRLNYVKKILENTCQNIGFPAHKSGEGLIKVQNSLEESIPIFICNDL